MDERFLNIAIEIGKLVQEKNKAYGSAFQRTSDLLKLLYPDGVKVDQYTDLLLVTRICDKLFRIANKKDAFGESPYKDLCGYSILGVFKDMYGGGDSEFKSVPVDPNLPSDWLEQAEVLIRSSHPLDIPF